MSKRAGAVAVTDYQKQGFLPEAIINYLMLLGWSPGNNQEICKIETAIKNFSIKKVNKAGAAFSLEKLKWINSEYIKQKTVDELADLLLPFLKEKGYASDDYDRKKLGNIIKLYQARVDTLADFLEWTDFIFTDSVSVSPSDREKHLTSDKRPQFDLLVESLNRVSNFDAGSAEAAFRQTVEKLGIKAGDLVHPVRVALTGKTVGPGLFETMAVLGKDKTVQRLKQTFS